MLSFLILDTRKKSFLFFLILFLNTKKKKVKKKKKKKNRFSMVKKFPEPWKKGDILFMFKAEVTVDITEDDMVRICNQLEVVFGEGYKFAPLRRSEGGIQVERTPTWPGEVEAMGQMNVRFHFDWAGFETNDSHNFKHKGTDHYTENWRNLWRGSETVIYHGETFGHFTFKSNEMEEGMKNNWRLRDARKFVSVLRQHGIRCPGKLKSDDFKPQ